MATYSRERRRGLPRVQGGEAWPPAGAAPESAVALSVAGEEQVAKQVPAAADAGVATEPRASDAPQPEQGGAAAPTAAVSAVAPTGRMLRQGLPRVAGGEPWPPESAGSVASAPAAAAAAADEVAQTPVAETAEVAPVAAQAAQSVPEPLRSEQTQATAELSDTPLRRGLPRVAGGEAWPPEGFAPVRPAGPAQGTSPVSEPAEPAAAEPLQESAPEPVAEAPAPVDQVSEPLAGPASVSAPAQQQAAEAPAAVDVKSEPTTPPPAKPAAPAKQKPKREPVMIREKTLGQWAKLVVLWGAGIVVAAGIIVLAARGVTTLPGVPEFMQRYPGEYQSPMDPEPGFPAWARWTHYLNFFFMLLVIRSGILVRTQQKPPAFFTPKKGGKKISIYLWLHTSIDVLWLLNGVVFVTLLFITGHWARIVPTSWEVFPNALSAGLQYLTLQWPVEDGWVNYNSLQQLMYFVVVFIAAPLAAITGVRMSEWWPEKAERLNRMYPAPVARAIHFPVMLFFVLFIIVHVFLVFTTGMLKNLNHMFIGTPEVSWAGFWMFVLGLAVAVGAVVAARPLVIAPIANLFGRVSNR